MRRLSDRDAVRQLHVAVEAMRGQQRWVCAVEPCVVHGAVQAAEPAAILAKNVEQGRKLANARRKALQQIEQLQQFINNIDTLDEAVQMYSMTICE